MKLQEAYASEKTELGNFSAIGYKTPGAGNNDSTTVFYYGTQKATAGSWDAISRVGLNDCNKGKKWYVTATFTSTTGNVSFTAGSDDVANCITALTPNFCNLATNGQCTNAASN